jgi:hypothetical protein
MILCIPRAIVCHSGPKHPKGHPTQQSGMHQRQGYYNDLGDNKWRIFGTVADTNVEQLENSKETHQVSVDNIDCNVSAASGVPITIEGKWRLKFKGHSVASDRTSMTHSLAP